jgi:hypothetical protein
MSDLLITNASLLVSETEHTNFFFVSEEFSVKNESAIISDYVESDSLVPVIGTQSFEVADVDYFEIPGLDTGIKDAPINSNLYVRRGGAWIVLDSVSFPPVLDSYLHANVDDLLDWQRVATGNSLDVEARYISIRDLLLMGIIVRTEDGYEYLRPGVDIISTGPKYMETPPAPTNLRAVRNILSVDIFFDPANLFYTNHGKTEVFRNTTDDLLTAVKVKETLAVFGDTDTAVSPGEVYFYWIRFVSATGVVGPYNSNVGTQAVVVDPSKLLEILGGAIAPTQLHPSLLGPIELITAPGGLVDSQIALTQQIVQETLDRAAAISAEAVARQQALLLEAEVRGTAINEAVNILESADQNLAEKVDFITSATNGTFDTAKIWQFDLLPAEGVDVTEGWVAGEGGVTVASGNIKPAASLNTFITSPVITVDGTKFTEVRLRIKKVGNPIWAGAIYFTTSLFTSFTSVRKVEVPVPVFFAGEAVVSWNMLESDDWAFSVITALRIQLSVITDLSNYFEIDWIGVGRAAPAASIAAIAEERVAWTTADAAEATARNTLAAQVRGGYEGSDITAVSSGLIFEEKTARANADNALAVQMALLTAGTSNQFDHTNVWYFDFSMESWTGNATPSIATP